MQREKFYPTLALRKRVLKLLESNEGFGGPQSVDDICKNLGILNSNSRSVLVRLNKLELIERIGKGVYRIKADSRSYRENKPHLG